MTPPEPPAWWQGVAPVTSTIACGPNSHRIRWREGRLDAPDHPQRDGLPADTDDAESDGGCLRLLGAWERHAANPAVLTLASRHPGDTLTLTAADLNALQAEAERATAQRRSPAGPVRPGADPLDRRLQLLQLLGLPPALQRRLQHEVAHHLAQDRTGRSDAVLEAATVGRLTPIAQRWAGSDHRIAVELSDERPGVSQRGPHQGQLTIVSVDRSWVADVWGRYLGSVTGFLVLEVRRIVPDRAEVLGVASPGAAPALLTLRGPAPWKVISRADPDD